MPAMSFPAVGDAAKYVGLAEAVASEVVYEWFIFALKMKSYGC